MEMTCHDINTDFLKNSEITVGQVNSKLGLTNSCDPETYHVFVVSNAWEDIIPTFSQHSNRSIPVGWIPRPSIGVGEPRAMSKIER